MVFTATVQLNATREEFRAPRGMLCSSPPTGATGTIRCTAPTLPPGATSAFTLLARIAPNSSGGGSSMMTVASEVMDPNLSNNRATAATSVTLPAPQAGRRPTETGPPAGAGVPTTSTTPVTGARGTRVPLQADQSTKDKHPDIGLSSQDIRVTSRDPQR